MFDCLPKPRGKDRNVVDLPLTREKKGGREGCRGGVVFSCFPKRKSPTVLLLYGGRGGRGGFAFDWGEGGGRVLISKTKVE